MKKIFYIFVFIGLFIGLYFLWNYDPYTNVKYGEDCVYSWFESENDISEVRRDIEGIREINSVVCEYIENDNHGKYLFLCNIDYNPKGQTVIPLANDENIEVYTIFIPDGNKYSSRVYNSGSEDGIWLLDEDLNYGK